MDSVLLLEPKAGFLGKFEFLDSSNNDKYIILALAESILPDVPTIL